MLHVPLKMTSPVDIVKPLTSYIKSKYSKSEAKQEAENIGTLNQMRRDAQGASGGNDANRDVVRRYIALVDKVKAKIPLGNKSLRLAFCWFSAFKPSKYVKYMSWDYERACFLWNLAALETISGKSRDRSSAAGVKAAAGHFAVACGIFTEIQNNVMPKLTDVDDPDFKPGVLKYVIELTQAQAQACFYEKAKTSIKPGTLAKLAHQAAALFAAGEGHAKGDDMARLTNSKGGWAHYCKFQYHCFVATAHWQQSKHEFQVAEAKADGYGVEIAHLNAALKAANAAKTTAGMKGSRLNPAHVAGLVQAIDERKRVAEHDNNTIYINAVPPVKSLPPIGKILMAKPTPLQPIKEDVPDLFTGLVPPEITAAACEFTEMMQKEAAELRAAVKAKTEEAKKELAELGLPSSVEAGDSKSGLPQSMWDKIQLVQSQGGVGRLQSDMERNARAASHVTEILNRVESELAAEEREDQQCRAQYGSRFQCTPSKELAQPMLEELRRYRGLLGPAAESDHHVRAVFDAGKAAIDQLARPKADLDAQIPSAVASGVGEAERMQLARTLKQLGDLFAVREELLSAYATKASRNKQVVEGLLKSGIEKKAMVFDVAKGSMDGERKVVDENTSQQDALMGQIRSENARFVAAREADANTRRREQALQGLQSSVDCFQRLYSELQEGDTFYKDLTEHVERLLENVQGHNAARAIERNEEVLRLRGLTSEEMQERKDEEFARRLQNLENNEQRGGGGAGGAAGAAGGAPTAAPVAPPAYATAAPSAVPSYGQGGYGQGGYGQGGYGATPSYGAAPVAAVTTAPPSYGYAAAGSGYTAPAGGGYAAAGSGYAAPAGGGYAAPSAAPGGYAPAPAAPAAPAYAYARPANPAHAAPAYTAAPVGGQYGAPAAPQYGSAPPRGGYGGYNQR